MRRKDPSRPFFLTVTLSGPSLVHFSQESLDIFHGMCVYRTRANSSEVINERVEINILLSDFIHDGHVVSAWKALDVVDLGGMSFSRTKFMSLLAIL